MQPGLLTGAAVHAQRVWPVLKEVGGGQEEEAMAGAGAGEALGLLYAPAQSKALTSPGLLSFTFTNPHS